MLLLRMCLPLLGVANVELLGAADAVLAECGHYGRWARQMVGCRVKGPWRVMCGQTAGLAGRRLSVDALVASALTEIELAEGGLTEAGRRVARQRVLGLMAFLLAMAGLGGLHVCRGSAWRPCVAVAELD